MRSLAWLGVAGLKIGTDEGCILIDPYVSRHTKFELLFRPLLPKTDAIASLLERLPNIEAIFVSHTHSDHAADVSELANRTGAKVCGSESLRTMLATFGADGNFVDLMDTPVVEGKGWKVTAIPSKHGKAILGKEPLPGKIKRFPKRPRTYHFRTGEVFNYMIEIDDKKIFHFGSAELVEKNIAKVCTAADVVFFCVPGWKKDDALKRMLNLLKPKVLVPFHYDDFTRPLDETDIKEVAGADLEGFVNTARALAPATKVIMVRPFEDVDISRLGEG